MAFGCRVEPGEISGLTKDLAAYSTCPHGVRVDCVCALCNDLERAINTEYANDIDRVRGKLPLIDSEGLRLAKKEGTAHVSSVVSVSKSEVDHPTHYSRWNMEPVEFIAINDLPWWLANVIKYTMRYDAKDGLKDLYKARSYLDMKIRQLEKVKRFWEKPVAEERRLNVGR